MRSSVVRPVNLLLGAFVGAVAVQACGPATTDASGTPSGPAFAVAVGAGALSLVPGGSASTSIKATRLGGLTSVISYRVSGTPVGLTASVAGTSVPDSSTLTVVAAAALSAATYPILVTASASGALPHEVTVDVSVSSGGAPAIEVVAAGAHACALTTVGAAYCWGFNGNGQLGNNEKAIDNPTPVAVAGGLTFQSLSLSKVEGVSCGLTTSGAAWCWGNNAGGQLGDGTTTERLAPAPVAGGLTFRSLAVGNEHVCGVATNGTAWCWGYSPNGAFGDGSVGTHPVPSLAAPGLTFQSVVAGSDFTCALTPAGAALCWGLGVFGQLGDGRAASSAVPVAVSGGLSFRSLAAGGQAVCGLTTSGKAYCWGNNSFGTVGDGTSATENGMSKRPSPVEVAGGLTFQSLSAGYETMCGVSDTGAGYCWGYNFGAIGDGTLDHRSSPAAVAGGLTFRSIASGTGFGCGVTSALALYCWGDGANGELGDGTTASHAVPAPVHWP